MSYRSAIEIIARGVLVEATRILICRNRKHGYGFLPGGHVEFGESAEESLRREFVEECGVKITVGDCLLVTEGTFQSGSKLHHEINLVFHVKREGDEAIESHEPAIEFVWLDRMLLTSHDIRPSGIKAWLCSKTEDRRSSSPTASWVSEVSV